MQVCQEVEAELRELSQECRKKYPIIKEYTDRAILKIRHHREDASRNGHSSGGSLGTSSDFPLDEVLRAILMACETFHNKIVMISLSCLQRLIHREALKEETVAIVVNLMKEQAANGDETVQLKVLQTIMATPSHIKLLNETVVEQLMQLLYSLHNSSNASVHHTACAGLRQLAEHLADQAAQAATQDRLCASRSFPSAMQWHAVLRSRLHVMHQMELPTAGEFQNIRTSLRSMRVWAAADSLSWGLKIDCSDRPIAVRLNKRSFDSFHVCMVCANVHFLRDGHHCAAGPCRRQRFAPRGRRRVSPRQNRTSSSRPVLPECLPLGVEGELRIRLCLALATREDERIAAQPRVPVSREVACLPRRPGEWQPRWRVLRGHDALPGKDVGKPVALCKLAGAKAFCEDRGLSGIVLYGGLLYLRPPGPGSQLLAAATAQPGADLLVRPAQAAPDEPEDLSTLRTAVLATQDEFDETSLFDLGMVSTTGNGRRYAAQALLRDIMCTEGVLLTALLIYDWKNDSTESSGNWALPEEGPQRCTVALRGGKQVTAWRGSMTQLMGACAGDLVVDVAVIRSKRCVVMGHDYNLPFGPWGMEAEPTSLSVHRELLKNPNLVMFCTSQHLCNFVERFSEGDVQTCLCYCADYGYFDSIHGFSPPAVCDKGQYGNAGVAVVSAGYHQGLVFHPFITAMGNAAATVLEIRLSIPDLSASQTSQLAVEVHAGSDTLRPEWGESFCLAIPESDVYMSIFSILEGCKSELGQIRLPASISHLVPGSPPRVMRFAVGTAKLVVEMRALDSMDLQARAETRQSKFHFQLPSARRQAIALELQNAELQKLARNGSHTTCAAPMKHRLLLERTEAANSQLRERKQRLLQKLERVQSIASDQLAPSLQGADQLLEDSEQIQIGLQTELHTALARQRALRETSEARIETITLQLEQAMEMKMGSAMPEAEAQALIAIATGRCEELRRLCRESQEINATLVATASPAAPPALSGLETLSPEIDGLLGKLEGQQTELQRLHRELDMISASENYKGWQQHKELSFLIQALSEELEQLQQTCRDDEVCFESEILELKRERNKAKNRLEDLVSDLKRLEARAEMLRTETPQVAAEESTLQRESCKKAEAKLRELEHIEELRQQQIRALERDQEKLVEQTTLATAKAVSGGEDVQREAASRILEFEQTLARLTATIAEKQDAAAKMRLQTDQVTFISPCPAKGLAVVLRLALMFGNIQFLCVSTGWTKTLHEVQLRAHPNINIVAGTDNIEEIYRQTAVLLMPSLWQESFGLVAVEAQLRGIPVVSTAACGLKEANFLEELQVHNVPLVHDSRTREMLRGITMEEAELALNPLRPGHDSTKGSRWYVHVAHTIVATEAEAAGFAKLVKMLVNDVSRRQHLGSLARERAIRHVVNRRCRFGQALKELMNNGSPA
eukprot:s3379_g15.t1